MPPPQDRCAGWYWLRSGAPGPSGVEVQSPGAPPERTAARLVTIQTPGTPLRLDDIRGRRRFSVSLPADTRSDVLRRLGARAEPGHLPVVEIEAESRAEARAIAAELLAEAL